jgi:hypothetical protein
MAGTKGLDWRLDIGRTRSLDIVGCRCSTTM